MKRLWISSMEDSAIREALQTCAPVQTMTPAGCGPLPRQSGLAGGYQCHPAVFRAVPPDPQHRTCHVPDAGLIVQREAEIDTFKPVPFYTVTLELPGFTVSGERMADKAAAQQLKTACQGAAATVKKVGRKNKSEKPPALYDLTTSNGTPTGCWGSPPSKPWTTCKICMKRSSVPNPRTTAAI